MKRLLFFLSLFLLFGQLSAQRYTPMPTWYEFYQVKFRDHLQVPILKKTTADSALLAYGDRKLWLKTDTGWTAVGATAELQAALNDTADALRSAIASSTITASGGINRLGNDVRLGGDSANATDAALQSTREIPLNGKNIYFSGDSGKLIIGAPFGSTFDFPDNMKARLAINDTSTGRKLLSIGRNKEGTTLPVTFRSRREMASIYNLDTLESLAGFETGIAKGLDVTKEEYITGTFLYNKSGQATNAGIYGELIFRGRDSLYFSNPGGDLISGIHAKIKFSPNALTNNVNNQTVFQGGTLYSSDVQSAIVNTFEVNNAGLAGKKVKLNGFYAASTNELIMQADDSIDVFYSINTGDDFLGARSHIKKKYDIMMHNIGAQIADSAWGIYEKLGRLSPKFHANHLANPLHIGKTRDYPVNWAALDVEGRTNITTTDNDTGIVINSTVPGSSSRLLRINSFGASMQLKGVDNGSFPGIAIEDNNTAGRAEYTLQYDISGKNVFHQFAPLVTSTGYSMTWRKTLSNNWGRLLIDNGHWQLGALGNLSKPDNPYSVQVYGSLYTDSFMVFNPQSAAPSNPLNGMQYYNSSTHQMLARINGAWVDIGAAGGSGMTDPGVSGILARTALNTTTARTITGTTGLITVTNGDGVSGNPTITVGPNVVQSTTDQTIGGIKSFTDRMVITKGAGVTPDVNNVLYLGRNEPGNFYPLGVFEDKTNDGYAQFGVWGKDRKWNFGVGNGPSSFFGVQDKFYVLDATSNNIRFTIDTDGTVEIPELLKAKGNVATRIRTITSSTTIDEYDHTILIDASGGPVTITLPTSASSYYGGYGITYVLKRIDGSGNTITIQPAGSDTIDGSPTANLNTSAKQTITIQAAGGTAWYIIKN